METNENESRLYFFPLNGSLALEDEDLERTVLLETLGMWVALSTPEPPAQQP